jgi:hypothetical protein
MPRAIRPTRPVAPPEATDDLAVLNGDPVRDVQQWIALPRDANAMLAERLRRVIHGGDDFVHVPPPRLADARGQQIAAAIESYKRETAVVDARLAREVTVQKKATALSDLCEHLRAETGIHLSAGSSVADDKVTLFCREMPLRDVMRQLSRPFGYTWLRTREPGAKSQEPGAPYRYELVQDLRSQLLEEELRNRDRNAALLALDQAMQAYRPYLALSPDEALAQSKTTPPAEKKRLEYLAGGGWGVVQLYFRLSPADLADLRAGESLLFSPEPQPGRRPLPPEMGRTVLQTLRNWRIRSEGDRWVETRLTDDGDGAAEGLPLARVPEARGQVTMELTETELGRFSLSGGSGFFTVGDRPGPDIWHARDAFLGRSPVATAVAPAVRNPQNAVANARLSRNPALQPRVSVQPRHSCRAEAALGSGLSAQGPEPRALSPEPGEAPSEAKVTSADVLEALHQATGLPIVSDYYTRLYALAPLSTRNQVLFDTLNRLADAMHMRWSLSGQGNWLQFRSASFFHDRLKEVPNRLLARWAAIRREQGALPLDALIEIAQLSDAQLDAAGMAEGARLCFGLEEWDLSRNRHLRPHLRYLASFTPAQRQQAQSPAGLPFAQMTLAQQQGFLTHVGGHPDYGLEELGKRILQVEYTQPGQFHWVLPGWRSYLRSRVRERTQAAALQAARRIDPSVPESQIVPTRLDVTILYAPADETAGGFKAARSDTSGWIK